MKRGNNLDLTFLKKVDKYAEGDKDELTETGCELTGKSGTWFASIKKKGGRK